MTSGVKITIDSAKERGKNLHHNQYDYSKFPDSISSIRTMVTVIHKQCNTESIISLHSHICETRPTGCKRCFLRRTWSTDRFLEKCHQLYPNNEYFFEKVVYKNNKKKVKIICGKCTTEFQVTPSNFISRKSGCPNCAVFAKRPRDKEKFLRQALYMQGDKFDYSHLTEHDDFSNYSLIKIVCNYCSLPFRQTSAVHIFKPRVCPYCNSGLKNQSMPEKEWLDKLSIHTLNRQVKLKNGSIADALLGNTIYEFYGSYWHGDPRRCLGYTAAKKKQLKSRYLKTIRREKSLLKLGYNIVFVWEYDYNNGLMFSTEHPKWESTT